MNGKGSHCTPIGLIGKGRLDPHVHVVGNGHHQNTSWVVMVVTLLFCTHVAPSGAPQRLTSDVRSSRVVNISWQPPIEEQQNGDIRQYRITLREDPTGREWSLITVTTSHLLDFLHPYYNYTVRVAAYTIDVGPYSESMLFTTHEDSKTGSTCVVLISSVQP